MPSKTFHELFLDELRDLYSAEKQITKALPKLIKAASNAELGRALEGHLDETRGQIERLERIFDDLGESKNGKKCKGMEGLLEEGDEHVKKVPPGSRRDAVIIAGAQRVEHYEIAGYGTARAWAEPSMPIRKRRAARAGPRTTSTGQRARRTTARLTLPRRSRPTAPSPREPTTIVRARSFRARARIACAGGASVTKTSASGQRRPSRRSARRAWVRLT